MFFSAKRRERKKGLTAVHVRPGGTSVAHTQPDGMESKLTGAFFIPATEAQTDHEQLLKTLQQENLTGTLCSLVLSPGEYQVLMVEAPDVPADEMRDALIWRVKDLVSEDVESVVLDYIELPSDAYRGQRTMLYVFVASQSLIEERVAWLESLSLEPICIDIPELALLNLTAQAALVEPGVLTLTLADQQALISILSSQSLYMMRSTDLNLNDIDSILLNLQRSLDFYENQMGKFCVRLLILPLQVGETDLLMALRENLSLDVGSLDIAQVVESDISLSIELQQQALMSIAGAFRPTELLTPGQTS